MDCHRPLAFAMTNETKNSCLWIASSFHSSQWQRNKRQYPPTPSLRLWNCHCETLQKGWESRYRDNHTQPTPSLREPKVRGNLSMEYYDSQTKLVIARTEGSWRAVSSDLWGFASLCKGGSCEATGGLREKLKIENWKLIFHLKLIL